MARTKNPTDPQPQTPNTAVGIAALVLVLTGLLSSLYLGHLYYLVHSPGAGQVESFCAVSESFNCVTVATSEYSSFLGLPIALYGIEFFTFCLVVLALSLLNAWPVRRWDSLLFAANLIGLPICVYLAWVSATKIHSFCIMCCTIYGVVVFLLLILGLAGGRGLPGSMLWEGPKQLLGALKAPAWGGTAAVVGLLAISQFFWVPGLLHAKPQKPLEHYKGLATDGLTIGPPDALIRIDEFTDFQCPYCGRAHQMMMTLLKRFPGKIRLTHRDFPLDMACNPKIPQPFHRQACIAAFYARCAGQQNKYWPYETLLFPNRALLSKTELLRFGKQVGLDVVELEKCAESEATRRAILADINEALKRGLEGTPTYYIAGHGKVVGLKSIEFWEAKIAGILKGKGSSSADGNEQAGAEAKRE